MLNALSRWTVSGMLLVSLVGCGAGFGPARPDATGAWQGSWFDVGGASGSLRMTLSQSGGAVTGTANLGGTCLVGDANLSASMEGDHFKGSFSGSLTQVTLEGTVSEKSFDGSYTVSKGLCAGAHGTFTLDRQ